MNVRFIAGFAPIVSDPDAAASLYGEVLGLPLRVVEGDYRATDDLDGAKHFGVWPLAYAAESCFGTSEWPAEIPVPQATIEFEVDDVAEAAAELEAAGHQLVHGVKTEPWGQTLARFVTADGLLVGVSETPWLR